MGRNMYCGQLCSASRATSPRTRLTRILAFPPERVLALLHRLQPTLRQRNPRISRTHDRAEHMVVICRNVFLGNMACPCVVAVGASCRPLALPSDRASSSAPCQKVLHRASSCPPFPLPADNLHGRTPRAHAMRNFIYRMFEPTQTKLRIMDRILKWQQFDAACSTCRRCSCRRMWSINGLFKR
jgi:hypothetical protein